MTLSARETRAITVDYHNALIGYFVNTVSISAPTESPAQIRKRFREIIDGLIESRLKKSG